MVQALEDDEALIHLIKKIDIGISRRRRAIESKEAK